MRFAIFAPIFFYATVTLASFDRQYEYRSFSINEIGLYNHYDKIDSEYSSDTLVYSFSIEEEVAFQNADKKLMVTLGSLSRREFMKDSRLKINQPLLEKLNFKYNYIEQEDYEQAQTHSIFEFIYKPTKSIHVSVFADLDFEKINDNVGVSFSFLPVNTKEKKHEVKIFLNAVQFDHNKRGENNDKFSKKPYSIGLIGRLKQSKYSRLQYFEYGFVTETPTQWDFHDDNFRYSYKRWMATLRYMHPLNAFEDISFFYQIDQRVEQKHEISTSNFIHFFDLERNQIQTTYKNRNFENYELEGGSYIVFRDAKFRNARWKQLDIVPYATFHFNKDEGKFGFWSFGYDIDFSRSKKEQTVPSIKNKVEHRGNIYWTAQFSDRAYLKFAFTADVDDFSWEGGNGQFAMEF